MGVVAFDTLKFAQALRDKARLTPEQAEGISQAFSDATSEQLVTKTDLQDVASRQDQEVMKADMVVMKADMVVMKADIFALKQDVAVLKKDVAELKQDVAILKQDVAVLKQDMAFVKSEIASIKIGMGEMKADILKWVFGISLAQAAMIIGVLRFMMPGH